MDTWYILNTSSVLLKLTGAVVAGTQLNVIVHNPTGPQLLQSHNRQVPLQLLCFRFHDSACDMTGSLPTRPSRSRHDRLTQKHGAALTSSSTCQELFSLPAATLYCRELGALPTRER